MSREIVWLVLRRKNFPSAITHNIHLFGLFKISYNDFGYRLKDCIIKLLRNIWIPIIQNKEYYQEPSVLSRLSSDRFGFPEMNVKNCKMEQGLSSFFAKYLEDITKFQISLRLYMISL